MNIKEIETQCLENYEKFKEHPENTMSTTMTPWTFVKKVEIYDVSVRYCSFYNNPPRWTWLIACGGAMAGEAKSVVDAIEKGEAKANERMQELAENRIRNLKN